MKNLANRTDFESLCRRLQALEPDTPEQWGRMTAHQMLCHLSDGFRIYMGLKEVQRRASPYERTVLKWLALWAPIPWPHGFTTVPEMDQEIDGSWPIEFESDRSELIHLMKQMAEKPKTFATWQPHPHFGRLSYREWMRLAYLHVAHHLRQFNC